MTIEELGGAGGNSTSGLARH